LGKRISKNETSFFENRIFGVEVYCGPISGEILVHTDELVRGGANLTVELQRRGTSTLIIYNLIYCHYVYFYAV
jgi:hypothetical protein